MTSLWLNVYDFTLVQFKKASLVYINIFSCLSQQPDWKWLPSCVFERLMRFIKGDNHKRVYIPYLVLVCTCEQFPCNVKLSEALLFYKGRKASVESVAEHSSQWGSHLIRARKCCQNTFHSPHPFSSLLSEQSSLLSHTWLKEIQWPFSHLNSPGGQVGAGVWHMCSSSSDSSPQSLSPSQTKSRDTQRPFWQVNWCCWQGWYVQPCSSLLSPQSLRRSHLIWRAKKMNSNFQSDSSQMISQRSF